MSDDHVGADRGAFPGMVDGIRETAPKHAPAQTRSCAATVGGGGTIGAVMACVREKSERDREYPPRVEGRVFSSRGIDGDGLKFPLPRARPNGPTDFPGQV